VEAATFGSEMAALRICKELIVAIHYKLRMFGVEIDGPANVFCNNHGDKSSYTGVDNDEEAQCN
jgi:hypothetical protein